MVFTVASKSVVWFGFVGAFGVEDTVAGLGRVATRPRHIPVIGHRRVGRGWQHSWFVLTRVVCQVAAIPGFEVLGAVTLASGSSLLPRARFGSVWTSVRAGSGQSAQKAVGRGFPVVRAQLVVRGLGGNIQNAPGKRCIVRRFRVVVVGLGGVGRKARVILLSECGIHVARSSSDFVVAL